jgi:hypothetical protein
LGIRKNPQDLGANVIQEGEEKKKHYGSKGFAG